MKINTEKHNLTQEELWRWVRYDPKTGQMFRILTRKGPWGHEKHINKLVTGKNNRGYFWINILGYMYLVHRLAFLYMTGKHPEGEVDHINGSRSDNRWCNLRETDCFNNARNQGIRKDCTSGVRGVNYVTHPLAGNKRWKARISHKGMRFDLGSYHTFEEAVAARRKAEQDYGYHENHAKRKAWKYE